MTSAGSLPAASLGRGSFFFLFFHRRGAEARRRVDALRWRWFPVSAGSTRCGGRELCLSVFRVDGKTPGGARCAATAQILSQGGGTVLSRRSLPEYTPVNPKISAAFQHSYSGKAKQHKA